MFLFLISPAFADPLVTVYSPENITYDVSTIDLNWSVNESFSFAFYSLNGGENISLRLGEWQVDNAIVVGLPDVGGNSEPLGFQKDGTLYLIAGESSGIFNGFNWTGSTWQVDDAIVSGLGDIGTSSSPEVYYKDGTWYLISGEGAGTFNGFNWTGSTWQVDDAIVSGLGDVGSQSNPETFYKDGIWYLIAGRNEGTFNGFNWTGSTWQADTAIVSGLGDVGTGAISQIYNTTEGWYLIVGESTGIFYGFNWTGSTWQADDAIVLGLGDVGSDSAPTLFYQACLRHLISGASDGKFYGFKKTCANTTITGIEGANNIAVYVINENEIFGSFIQYFTVDTTAPTITIYSPENTTYGTTSIDLNVLADETIDTWHYSLNGGSNITFTPNTTITSTEGSNNVTVYANDTVGNIGSQIAYFTLDNTPPQNVLNILPYDTDHTNVNRTNFTWSVDYDIGLHFDLVILNATDNSTILNKTGITNQYYALTVLEELADWDYTWSVIAYDLFNQSNTSASTSVTIDTVLPDIILTDYPNPYNTTIVSDSITLDVVFDDTYLFAIQGNITNSTGHLFWNKTDINLTTDNYSLNDTIDTSTWDSGTYTITLYAEDDHTLSLIDEYDVIKDLIDNQLDYKMDSTDISIAYDILSGTKLSVVDFDTVKLDDRYVFDYSFVPKILPIGELYTYEFSLESNEIIYYRGDLYTYPSFVTGDHWVDFNVEGKAKVIYTVKKQTDKLYKIIIETTATKLNFNSLGGLNTITESYQFKVDKTAPVLTFVSPTPDNDTTVWVSDGMISVESNEALADNQVWLEISGGNQTMTKINATDYYYDFNLSDGNYTYKVYAYDPYGNLGVSETREFIIDTVTPPIFLIDRPQNITYNAMSVSLDVTSSGREVVEWYFSVDYEAWDSFTPNTTLVGFEENGVYRLDVLAIDVLGLNTTEMVYFTLNYTGFKFLKNMTCIASDTHYVSINPFADDDLRWSCRLDTTEKFYCLTRVYGNDEYDVKDESKLIQTNPKRKVVKRYGLIDYFESVGGVSNVYFTDEKLIPDANYTYEVECYSLSGVQYGAYSDSVAVEYKSMVNTMAMGVWGIGNMGYIFGAFFLIIIFLIILKLGVRK